MAIFIKRRKSKDVKTSKLDRYSGKWVAIQGEDEVVAYGETVEEILDHVKVEGKMIGDDLPDPRETPSAMKLPDKKKI